MQFYYIQLQHAVGAHGFVTQWTLSPNPIFTLISSVEHAKGLICQCYNMLLCDYLDSYPTKVRENWEVDMGSLSGDQLGDVLQAVATSSLIISQKLSQFYIY